MRLRNVWVYTLGLSLAATVACGGGQESSTSTAPATAPAAGGQRVDAATAATVTGIIALEGTPPPNETIRMNADPVCMKEAKGPQTQDTYVVGSDGKTLGNVFVYVKDGLGNRVYATPEMPVVLDQQGCRYEPHVFGVFVGQPVEIRNSDPTLHNVHAIPNTNREFNFGQQPNLPPLTRSFDEPEIGLPIRCDVHGWMRAYANVVTHPFFAVTAEDGMFEIKGLPPGTYTIEAWHERLGTQTQQVTISEGSPSVMAAFTFKAST